MDISWVVVKFVITAAIFLLAYFGIILQQARDETSRTRLLQTACSINITELLASHQILTVSLLCTVCCFYFMNLID